jgi:5-methyltetrahydrofolate--homocysteine methyltransferase
MATAATPTGQSHSPANFSQRDIVHPLIQTLIARTPVITDGAWGTQLQALGLSSGDCPDAWNLSQPEKVREVAHRYVSAGSEVILTNTFRSNRIALEGFGLSDQVAALNRAGVEHSRHAAEGKAKVFASIGPSGKMLMTDEVTVEQLSEGFREQADALAAAGPDALLIETMSDIEEALIALQAARDTGLPVVVSMVFDSGKEKDRTMMGKTVEEVARLLTEAGADVIGANCGLGIERYVPIGRRLRAATDRPVWIKPNAGLPEIVNGRMFYRTTPEQFAAEAIALRDAGVHFLGGCCGTTPEHIRALRDSLASPR